jgi:hypothetical protein
MRRNHVRFVVHIVCNIMNPVSPWYDRLQTTMGDPHPAK